MSSLLCQHLSNRFDTLYAELEQLEQRKTALIAQPVLTPKDEADYLSVCHQISVKEHKLWTLAEQVTEIFEDC